VLRRLLLVCLILVPVSVCAYSDWQQPTPDELKMTSDPAAPDSPAVYLFREETVDDTLNMHSTYARIKILTEKGKEMFSDIEIPYEAGNYSITNIAGRTVHSDGTVIPFEGKPIDKLVTKYGGVRIMEKVFSMPDVQVGSIIEYRWKLRYDSGMFFAPYWIVQQPVFVHSAHYHFKPTADMGHEGMFTYILPTGVKPVQQSDGYDLRLTNIPALPDEDYMPPMRSFSYRLIFYYSSWSSSGEFWENEGKTWSKQVNHFADPGQLHDVAAQMMAPGDSDLVKAQKTYFAVMKLENTSFTREHSAEENKAEGLRVKTAADIWQQKRGDADEITRLYIGLLRAEGLRAYSMAVVNRDLNLFQVNFLNWNQLDNEIAIVSIGGKDVYLDPGERYCEFGRLHWKHNWATGVRQTDSGTAIATTPGLNYLENHTDRYAQLTLSPDGQVSGFIRETMSGAAALHWRQLALSTDDTQLKKDFQEQLQPDLPPGVQVKTNHFVGLDHPQTALMVQVDVSGSLGTATGKRVFIPAVFFEANAKPLFAQSKRENNIDLHYPYIIQDQVSLTLPPGLEVESLPKPVDVPFALNGNYIVKFAFINKDNLYAYGRLFCLANFLYKTEAYSSLRDFYQKSSAADQSQLVLKVKPVTAASGGNGQ
jgi:hypothetical protein